MIGKIQDVRPLLSINRLKKIMNEKVSILTKFKPKALSGHILERQGMCALWIKKEIFFSKFRVILR